MKLTARALFLRCQSVLHTTSTGPVTWQPWMPSAVKRGRLVCFPARDSILARDCALPISSAPSRFTTDASSAMASSQRREFRRRSTAGEGDRRRTVQRPAAPFHCRGRSPSPRPPANRHAHLRRVPERLSQVAERRHAHGTGLSTAAELARISADTGQRNDHEGGTGRCLVPVRRPTRNRPAGAVHRDRRPGRSFCLRRRSERPSRRGEPGLAVPIPRAASQCRSCGRGCPRERLGSPPSRHTIPLRYSSAPGPRCRHTSSTSG